VILFLTDGIAADPSTVIDTEQAKLKSRTGQEAVILPFGLGIGSTSDSRALLDKIASANNGTGQPPLFLNRGSKLVLSCACWRF